MFQMFSNCVVVLHRPTTEFRQPSSGRSSAETHPLGSRDSLDLKTMKIPRGKIGESRPVENVVIHVERLPSFKIVVP